MGRKSFSYKEYSEQLEMSLAGARAKNRQLRAELKALKAQLPPAADDETYDWAQHMPEFADPPETSKEQQ
jgi:multidrug resistance efflux pump